MKAKQIIFAVLALLMVGCVEAEPKAPPSDTPQAPADPCKHTGEPGAYTVHCVDGWAVECLGFEVQAMTEGCEDE